MATPSAEAATCWPPCKGVSDPTEGALLPACADPGTSQVAYFVNSGTEATEMALLMARLYTGSFDMLTLRNSYHGSGLIGHGTWTYNCPTVSPSLDLRWLSVGLPHCGSSPMLHAAGSPMRGPALGWPARTVQCCSL